MRTRFNPGTVIASLVLAPAIVTGLVIAILEAGRVHQPGDPLFESPPPASLGQAILDGNVEAAYARVRGGEGPDTPIDIELPGAPGQVARITPLTLAVAARDLNDVQMLLTAGADVALPANRVALCLARERGYAEIVKVLERAAPGDAACPARAVD